MVGSDSSWTREQPKGIHAQPDEGSHLSERGLSVSSVTITEFDFLAGRWNSRQRRLVEVFAGSDEWYEFDATLDCQVLLDGHATFDVLRAPDRDLEGITLRLYSPQEQVWRIWWAAKSSGGQLDTRSLVDSTTGSAPSSATTRGRARPSGCATGGRRLTPTNPVGNRHSRPTAGKPGRSTGWRRSPADHQSDAIQLAG